MNYSNKPDEKCPYCHDTGWEVYRKYVEDVGYEAEFGRRCTHCNLGHNQTPSKVVGIPEEYIQKGVSNFRTDVYNDQKKAEAIERLLKSLAYDINTWIKEQRWLYLWSDTPGTGKTLFACIVANHVKDYYTTRFITAADYLQIVGDSYKREQGSIDESKQYRECDVLVLDDIGTQKKGEWQEQEMFKLINQRYCEHKMTIFTSNVNSKDLKLNDRTVSRITSQSLTFRMPEVSVREMDTDRKNTEFYKRFVLGGR